MSNHHESPPPEPLHTERTKWLVLVTILEIAGIVVVAATFWLWWLATD